MSGHHDLESSIRAVSNPIEDAGAADRFGIWSADYSSLNGQAIVTARAAALLKSVAAESFVYRGRGWRLARTWTCSSLRLIWHAATGRVTALYMVCSRSNFGFLRDLPAYMAGLMRLRIVIHVHGSDIVDLLRRPLVGGIARRLMRNCELVVPSKHLMQPLRDMGIQDVRVCENFVEEVHAGEPRIAPPVSANSVAESGLCVVWNSNILASKGFFETAEAVGSLSRKGLAVKLIALGAPLADSESTLEECRTRLHVLRGHEWFDYQGVVERATSNALLQRANVACLPSRYSSECQPLALAEAMCAGLQLVAADSPALRATVGDYPCAFVNPMSVDSIAAALERACNAPDAMMMAIAARRAQERFSARRFDAELCAILRIPVPSPAPAAMKRLCDEER